MTSLVAIFSIVAGGQYMLKQGAKGWKKALVSLQM
jgi:hypothetical protein